MNASNDNHLPVKSDLKLLYINTVILILLITGVSIAGIVLQENVYPGDETAVEFVSNDILNLTVGLPLLVIPMILTFRRRLTGFLCFPAALLYVAYIYTTYLLGLPFGILFIPYLLLVTISIYTLIGLILQIDGERIREKMEGRTPVRAAGIILLSLASLTALYQLYQIVNHLVQPLDADRVMIAQWIVDLVIACPVVLLVGLRMIRRKTTGYVLGIGILLWMGVLFVGLVPVIIATALLTGTPIKIVDIVIVTLSSLICFIPFSLMVRGIPMSS